MLPPVAPTLVQPQAGPANTAIEELEATVARQTADLCATLHTLHTQPHTPDALFWNILVIPCVKPQDELSKPHTALKRKPSMTENCSLTDRDSRHLHIGP